MRHLINKMTKLRSSSVSCLMIFLSTWPVLIYGGPCLSLCWQTQPLRLCCLKGVTDISCAHLTIRHLLCRFHSIMSSNITQVWFTARWATGAYKLTGEELCIKEKQQLKSLTHQLNNNHGESTMFSANPRFSIIVVWPLQPESQTDWHPLRLNYCNQY